MTTISRSALVMHLPENMYGLVNDVASYPQFLPWCSNAEVLESGKDQQTASVEISMAAVKQRFTTKNIMAPNKRIDMTLVDGPFSHLNGSWHFKALGQTGCKISLDIDFDFSNPVIARSVGPVFNVICGSLVDAFCKRADEICR